MLDPEVPEPNPRPLNNEESPKELDDPELDPKSPDSEPRPEVDPVDDPRPLNKELSPEVLDPNVPEPDPKPLSKELSPEPELWRCCRKDGRGMAIQIEESTTGARIEVFMIKYFV